MTQQFPDTVTFRRLRYAITAVAGAGLFDPGTFGLSPYGWNTACWRGVVCHYAVASGHLGLRALEIGLKGPPPAIQGILPSPHPLVARLTSPTTVWRYEGLRIPVAFSGKLLLGRGRVESLPYLHMGFEPAWRYATVWDLAFEDGRLRAARDCSAELAAVRERPGDAGGRPRDGDGGWVERTFSLSYAYSWPQTPDR